MSKPKLPLHELASRHRGLTDAIASSYTEAARVCLDRHHKPPTEFIVQNGDDNLETVAEWDTPDDRAKAAWANEIDTTEAGAYACALAAAELANGLYAVKRAETLTGADYYVAPADHDIEDLEDCYRFEVSGINKGTEADVSYRLTQKLHQAVSGRSNLPAMAGVVGFKIKLIKLKTIDES